ncbi:MAG: aminopeptidase [Flavobacterium sp.]
MKIKRFLSFIIFFTCTCLHSQNRNTIIAEVNAGTQTIGIQQEITFTNQSAIALDVIVLNDWMHAYSNKETPLARRFADEFVRAFHMAPDEDRGYTAVKSIKSENAELEFSRPEKHPDIVEVKLAQPLQPGASITLSLDYGVKIPNDRFTRYGFDNKGNMVLKNWYLTPARFENGAFRYYSNENLDDIANSVTDFDVMLSVPSNYSVISDLNTLNISKTADIATYSYFSKGRTDFSLYLENGTSTFEKYNFDGFEVITNLKTTKTTGMQRTLVIENVVSFVKENLGAYPYEKITVSQTDYDRNPVYGLNQLPSFLSPFPDSFLYEVRFLKTYLNNYLKNTLKIDPRRDNWLYDGMQMHLMMKYIDEHHPDKHMTGTLANWGILRGHNLFRVSFNGQYNYLYLLMARKNLDQPIGDPKNTFIKFNEQISGKYRAGLSFNYLNDYLGDDAVQKSFAQFFAFNKTKQASREDFRAILNANTTKPTHWFFETVVETRDLIDFRFEDVKEDKDSIAVTVKNHTGADVPVSLFGINKGEIVFKQWIDNVKTDSTLVIPRNDAEKLVLNYNNAMPEYNTRNNWHRLGKFFPNNRPFKFTFFQDLEDPRYNQVFYVPSFVYNLYDGVSVGMRFHNKSLLEKPFIFDIEPTYSSKTQSLIGSVGFLYNHYIREGNLYNIRYGLSGSTYHYAPDAAYVKFTPSVQFRIRDNDYRENKKQFILARYVMVDREASVFANTSEQNENYSVFNLRYSKYENTITRLYSYFTDAQFSNNFGKLSGEIQFRRLFNDNRQINLRLYAGMFLYRDTNSEFFSFGLDRPTDYLFDYNFYGRSEETGLFSQQFILAEGGFKSKLDTRYANQWMTTLNGSFNIWNWIEVYGDAGLFQNKFSDPKFVWDSGIRLNLVPDYFELFFPVYSSNGFEIDNNYGEKIRFTVTISPSTLINLFTRKWL